MRITSLMMQMNLKSNLATRMSAIAKASEQASTGLRIETVSDDPVDASQVMSLQAQIADVEQYKRNGTFATTQLSTEDAALSSLRDAIASAKQLAMSTTSADPNDPTRQAALSQALALKDQIVALGNTRVGDQYVFGGDANTTPPFQSDGTYVGNSGAQQVTISDGVSVNVNHPGQPLFTDAITSINGLITQLQSGTPDQIAAATDSLQTADQTALETQSEIGSQLQNIQSTSSNLATQSSQLLDQRDALMNVDPATSLVTLQQQQTALEQAYAVVGRVLQTSLTDYLQ